MKAKEVKGKNFKIINEYGISYKLKNKNLNPNHNVGYLFHKEDLEVQNFEVGNNDMWFVMKDLDGEYFAQPIHSKAMLISILSGPWEKY